MSNVSSDLLALARALRVGQVTPMEVAERLEVLAHRLCVVPTRAAGGPGGTPAPRSAKMEVKAHATPGGASRPD